MPSQIDNVIARGSGLVKGMAARMHGLQGVFKLLAEQHGEAGALLKRIKHDDRKRAELWPKVRQALVSHEQGELREVYPALRERAETRSWAEQHEREAAQLSTLIERIDATAMASPEWGVLFAQLVSMVEQHVREEEDEIFPKAMAVLGAERARQIEPRFVAAQQQLAATIV